MEKIQQNCKSCGKSFSCSGNLKTHICLKRSVSEARNLKKRINKVHEDNTCELCGKSFSQSGNLKTHI